MKYGTRTHGHSSCQINKPTSLPEHMWRDFREVTHVQTPVEHRRGGEATVLMEKVCKEADEKRMMLLLIPEPYGDIGMDREQLIAWYVNKFEFTPIQQDPVILVRMYRLYDSPAITEQVNSIIMEAK